MLLCIQRSEKCMVGLVGTCQEGSMIEWRRELCTYLALRMRCVGIVSSAVLQGLQWHDLMQLVRSLYHCGQDSRVVSQGTLYGECPICHGESITVLPSKLQGML